MMPCMLIKNIKATNLIPVMYIPRQLNLWTFILLSFLYKFISNDSPTENSNLALRKPTIEGNNRNTFLNSTLWPAWKAVDGSYAGNMQHDQCANTRDGPKYIPGWHWWQVDLQGNFTITHITLTNRKNKHYIDRLSNFTIEVSMDSPKTMRGFPGLTQAYICLHREQPVPQLGPHKYNCVKPVIGRYIRIVKYTSRPPLTVCEFEAFGEPYTPTSNYSPTTEAPVLSSTDKPTTRGSPPSSQTTVGHQEMGDKSQDFAFEFTTTNGITDVIRKCCIRRISRGHFTPLAFYIITELQSGFCTFRQLAKESVNSNTPIWTVYNFK